MRWLSLLTAVVLLTTPTGPALAVEDDQVLDLREILARLLELALLGEEHTEELRGRPDDGPSTARVGPERLER